MVFNGQGPLVERWNGFNGSLCSTPYSGYSPVKANVHGRTGTSLQFEFWFLIFAQIRVSTRPGACGLGGRSLQLGPHHQQPTTLPAWASHFASLPARGFRLKMLRQKIFSAALNKVVPAQKLSLLYFDILKPYDEGCGKKTGKCPCVRARVL